MICDFPEIKEFLVSYNAQYSLFFILSVMFSFLILYNYVFFSWFNWVGLIAFIHPEKQLWDLSLILLLSFVFFFAVLRIEPISLYVLGMCSATELHPWPTFPFLKFSNTIFIFHFFLRLTLISFFYLLCWVHNWLI